MKIIFIALLFPLAAFAAPPAPTVLEQVPYRDPEAKKNGDSFAYSSSTGEYVRYNAKKEAVEYCKQKDLNYTCTDPLGKPTKKFTIKELNR